MLIYVLLEETLGRVSHCKSL